MLKKHPAPFSASCLSIEDRSILVVTIRWFQTLPSHGQLVTAQGPEQSA